MDENAERIKKNLANYKLEAYDVLELLEKSEG
jgi:hypothetical protein